MQQKGSFRINFLSVVIPTYKQEKSIVKDTSNIEKTLKSLGYRYEIIVVVDGFVDNSYEKISKLKSNTLKVIGYRQNQGKGHAIRLGMLHAKGDVIGFIDGGMDINPAGLNMLLSHMEWYNADIIVGSKLHPVSKVNYPIWRRILSWGYRFLTKQLFGFKVRDTQVGLKFFKKKVIRDILPLLIVKKYAFDIEILAVAYRMGYKRIYEAPVEINFKPNTIQSANLWKVILFMLWDTFAVFYRLKILKYYDRKKLLKKKLAPQLQVLRAQTS